MSDELTPEEAIRAMLNGETLRGQGVDYWFREGRFVYGKRETDDVSEWISEFTGLSRKPAGKTRPMTHEEILAWAVSADALGWVIRYDYYDWMPPQRTGYPDKNVDYFRARIAPDGTISDEQGFEVGEKE
jgi:hypothetical protein